VHTDSGPFRPLRPVVMMTTIDDDTSVRVESLLALELNLMIDFERAVLIKRLIIKTQLN
jgi:hypothetical protein